MENSKNKPPLFVIILFLLIVIMIIGYFVISAMFPEILNDLDKTDLISK